MKRPADAKVDVFSSPVDGAPPHIKVGARYRLWSASSALGLWWSSFTLQLRSTILITIVVTMAMAALGYWVERKVRVGWTHTMAEVAAKYVEVLVAPYLNDLEAGKPLSGEAKENLTKLLTGTPLGAQVKIIKIWSIAGEVIFSTDGTRDQHPISPKDLARLLRGEVIAVANNPSKSSPTRPGMIEIYLPVRSRVSPSTVTGIVEFYNATDPLNRDIRNLNYALWILIINVSIGVGIIIFVLIRRAARTIESQQTLLEKNVARAAALAKQNKSLRHAADRARIRAAVVNEEYLSRIGADLHDGPIQMLSLMMLRLPKPSGDPTAEYIREQWRPLIEQTLGELRNLSAGLVLPTIRDLSPLATIEAAVSYHEQNTGTMVSRHLADLPNEMPEAIRICAFRVIQETLMNAYKHADGNGQRVEASFEGGNLLLLIEDAGTSGSSLMSGGGLGLRGLQTRVNALRGSLSISRKAAGGMAVRVRLPVRARSLMPTVSRDRYGDQG